MIHRNISGFGPTLLLIHGFPNDSSTWYKVIEDLEMHFKCITIDLPGAGKSPYINDLTIDKMVDEIVPLLKGEEQVFVAGHSMGGYVALALAKRIPNQIIGVSLIHSSGAGDSEERKIYREKAIRLLEKGTLECKVFLKAMAQNMFAEKFGIEHPQVLNALYEKGMELPAQHLAALYNAIMHRDDQIEWLRNNRLPIQWIIGADDRVIPYKEVLQQVHLPLVSAVKIYSDVGHLVMEEEPERLSKDLINFGHYLFNV